MTGLINETHDPGLRCRVESAHSPDTDFPIQNLPFGVFRRKAVDEPARVGVAVGDQIVDVAACRRQGMFQGVAETAAAACAASSLNELMSLDSDHWSALRLALSRFLRADSLTKPSGNVACPMKEAELLLPVSIGDYTDFYASIHHATRVGRLFRPDNPLLPNYKWVPIAYHGRSSSIVVSPGEIRRPSGQTLDDRSSRPAFGPTRQLDYELEVGFFIGQGNPPGVPIPIQDAGRHVFGFCLVNDWSARDIQAWEYQPLGPFLSKSFATTISPWIVTREALEPYRTARFKRPDGDPEPLPHLSSPDDQDNGGFDVRLEVYFSSRLMRDQGIERVRLSQSNLKDLYWTVAQMVAHHTSNGCNLRPGDLLASGTVSGADDGASGCLLELTRRGAQPIVLSGGESRTFLEDGDEVTLRGYCERHGYGRIGFGECRGRIR